jgi:hypothetical protein
MSKQTFRLEYIHTYTHKTKQKKKKPTCKTLNEESTTVTLTAAPSVLLWSAINARGDVVLIVKLQLLMTATKPFSAERKHDVSPVKFNVTDKLNNDTLPSTPTTKL